MNRNFDCRLCANASNKECNNVLNFCLSWLKNFGGKIR